MIQLLFLLLLTYLIKFLKRSAVYDFNIKSMNLTYIFFCNKQINMPYST